MSIIPQPTDGNRSQPTTESSAKNQLHNRINELSAEIKERSVPFQTLIDEVGQVIVGQKDLIKRMLIGLLGNGHLLIEGVPGLAEDNCGCLPGKRN